jgi:hypothetical protein
MVEIKLTLDWFNSSRVSQASRFLPAATCILRFVSRISSTCESAEVMTKTERECNNRKVQGLRGYLYFKTSEIADVGITFLMDVCVHGWLRFLCIISGPAHIRFCCGR